MWFYEHTTRFANHDKRRFPRIASWARVDHGGRYDANELLRDVEEQEVILTEFHICCCISTYACLASMDMYVQVIPVLYPRDGEIVHPTVRDFMGTDEFGYYVDDGEVSH